MVKCLTQFSSFSLFTEAAQSDQCPWSLMDDYMMTTAEEHIPHISTLHILKHKHPGTLNTHLLKMDVWWFPTISQVKVWFQLKQPIQNPGCLVRLPGMWPSVGGRFNHFQAFKSLVVFRGAQPVSQLAVCFSSGPDLGVRALQTERKEGSGTERYVRKVAYLRVYIYIYYYLYKYIYIYLCIHFVRKCRSMIDPYFDYKIWHCIQ